MVTAELVALKVLRPNPYADADATARLVAEARAMAAVRHPRIVRILDAGVARTGEAFIAMELERGTTLKDLAEQRAVPPPRALDIARQVLDALAALHAKGIVHRDVKPSNVLVVHRDGLDFVRLLDFGISKVPGVGPMTLPGSSLGTPGFMAPELFGDAAGADGRADLYAVGAMLYELLSGRLPFVAQSYEDLVFQVRAQPAPPLRSVAPYVPNEVAQAVDRALARDRDARWRDAASFAAALQGVPIDAVAPTLPRQTAPGPSLDSNTSRALVPPLASTKPNTGSSWVGWAIGGALTIAVLGLGGAGAWTVWRGHTATAAEKPVPLPSSSPTPTPTTPAASVVPAAAAEVSRVSFGAIHVVGRVSGSAMASLTSRATPGAQRCSVPGHTVVKTNLFVQGSGEITLVQPANDNRGDPGVAECVGSAFKDAVWPGFVPGPGGIVTVTATLDPK